MMPPSEFVFRTARMWPTGARALLRMLGPHLPPHWVLSHLARDLHLRIPVKASLANGMSVTVLLGDGVGEAIRRDGLYEPATVEVLQSRLKPGCVFFDVGAHVGQYTLMASPTAFAVHCFEPIPPTFDMLCQNISANQLKNVIANNYAISDHDGEIEIYEAEQDNLGASSMALPDHYSGRSFPVKCVCLDSYVDSVKALPDFVKIDVEGAELHVIRGALRTLRSKRPTLIVEFSETNLRRCGHTCEELARELTNAGYALSAIGGGTIGRVGEGFVNVLATPV